MQTDVAMSETYQSQVDTITANMENEDSQEAERLRGLAGDAADNLEIDAVMIMMMMMIMEGLLEIIILGARWNDKDGDGP